MGTCTVTIRQTVPGVGPFKAVICDIAPSASYATGGETITLASLGLKTIQAIDLTSPYSGAALFHPAAIVYGTTPTSDAKMMLRDVVTGAQVTSAFDASTAVIRAICYGEGPFSN